MVNIINTKKLSKTALLKAIKNPSEDIRQFSNCIDQHVETNRALARREDATSEILSKLSHSSDKITRREVVSNPGVDPEDFLRLGSQFSNQFLTNPLLDFLLIENPGLFNQFDNKLLCQILKRKECPEIFLSWAVAQNNENLALAVATNPEIPESLIKKLKKSRYPAVVDSMKYLQVKLGDLTNEGLEEVFKAEILNRIKKLTPSEPTYMISVVQLPIIEYKKILSMTREYYYLSDEGKHFIDLDLDLDSFGMYHLDRCLLSKKLHGKRHYANWPINVLRIFAKDPCENVRLTIAIPPSTPTSILELLAKDNSASVRRYVAKNTNCSEAILMMLAKSNDAPIKHSIALNPNCTVAIFKLLINDDKDKVKWYVIENPNCPVEILELLVKNLNKGNGRNTLLKSEINSEGKPYTTAFDILVKNNNAQVRQYLAQNTNCPVSILEKLVNDNDYEVRQCVAKNHNCSPAILITLSCDKSDSVKQSVAGNQNCPVEILELLAEDKDKTTRNIAATNPNNPIEKLEALAKNKNKDIRRLLAANPESPLSVLTILTKDKVISVRHAVVNNPACHPTLLTILAKDKATSVKEAVSYTPGCPDKLILEIYSDTKMNHLLRKSPVLNGTILSKIGENKNPLIRDAALSNFNHPEFQRTLKYDLPKNKWFLEQLEKSSTEAKNAFETGNILYFCGDANKTVYSTQANVLSKVLAIADNTRVLPERLARVSKNSDWLIRMAVARNLGTPPNILNVLKNDGNVLVAAQAVVTDKMLNGELLPPPNNLATRWNRSTIVNELITRISEATNVSGKSVDNSYPFIVEDLGGYNSIWMPAVHINALASEHTDYPKAKLETLSKDKDEGVRRNVADNSNCPAAILEILSKDKDEGVRSNVSYNPNCPAATLETLFKDKNSGVTGADVAYNPNCPAAILETLSKDKNSGAKEYVASNPNCPIAILKSLSKDKDEYTRECVASNLNCPADILEILAKDKNAEVRKTVARNTNCPAAILEILAKEEISYNFRFHMINIKEAVASNTSCPLDILVTLSKDKDNYVKKAIASNPSCPLDTLVTLSKDKDKKVRHAIGWNPNCPLSLLNTLGRDNVKDVRFRVSKHPKLIASQSKDLKKYLFKVDPTKKIKIEPEKVTRDDIRNVFYALIIMRKDSDNKAITKLSRSEKWIERVAAASHPNVTDAQLNILRLDLNAQVSGAAEYFSGK